METAKKYAPRFNGMFWTVVGPNGPERKTDGAVKRFKDEAGAQRAADKLSGAK